MASVSVAEAKAGFSGLVDEAANGEFVTITRDGRPAAVLVSPEAAAMARRVLDQSQTNFGDFLLSYPGGADLTRNTSGMDETRFE